MCKRVLISRWAICTQIYKIEANNKWFNLSFNYVLHSGFTVVVGLLI